MQVHELSMCFIRHNPQIKATAHKQAEANKENPCSENQGNKSKGECQKSRNTELANGFRHKETKGTIRLRTEIMRHWGLIK